MAALMIHLSDRKSDGGRNYAKFGEFRPILHSPCTWAKEVLITSHVYKIDTSTFLSKTATTVRDIDFIAQI